VFLSLSPTTQHPFKFATMFTNKNLPSLPRGSSSFASDLKTLQEENSNLRQQLAAMMMQAHEQNELITTLRTQNRSLLRRVSSLSETVTRMARTMKEALSEWSHGQGSDEQDAARTEEITVYSYFESD
jgi:uncharacterized protein YigA (DUF484 family)